MNYIWSAMIIISLVFACFNGKLDQTVSAAFSGAENAVGAVIAMAGVFCFWSGILKIAEKSGFSKILSKLISPVIKFIFPKLSKDGKAFSHITMNVVANLMGMGNAATPAGIDAMCELDRLNGYSPYVSDEMCLLVVMNTASIQLMPTTILSLRSSVGSANPGAVIVPIWIASVISLVSAVIMMKLIILRGRKK